MDVATDNQKTSFLTDIKRRPLAYLRDLKDSGAAYFVSGNCLYLAWLWSTTGANVATIGGSVIQSSVLSFNFATQARATYQGEHYDTPFKVNGWGNVATVALLVGTAAYYGIKGEADETAEMTRIENPAHVLRLEQTRAHTPILTIENEDIPTLEPIDIHASYSYEPYKDKEQTSWQQFVFPILTLGLWAGGLFSFGGAAERKKMLAKHGTSDEEIAQDTRTAHLNNRGEIFAGIADVTAVFKDKTAEESLETIQKAIDAETYINPLNPENLHHLNSIAGFPFFLIGFYMAIHKGKTPIIGGALEKMEDGLHKALPRPVRAVLHIENQPIGPVHLYTAGYASTSLVSTISAYQYDSLQAFFAAATGLWSYGYHTMTAEHTNPPESANEYTIRMNFISPKIN